MSLSHYKRWARAGIASFLKRVPDPVLLYRPPRKITNVEAFTDWGTIGPNGFALGDLGKFSEFELKQVAVAPIRKRLEDGASWITVGRSRKCDVIIPVPVVSSVHAAVEPRGSGYVIVDRGSSNGTYVDGKRVRQDPWPLQDGALIVVGTLAVMFLLPTTLYEQLQVSAAPPAPGEPDATDAR